LPSFFSSEKQTLENQKLKYSTSKNIEHQTLTAAAKCLHNQEIETWEPHSGESRRKDERENE
jgi:hypothetical protein